MRNRLIGLGLAAAALFGGWYYASPLYAMNALRDAAQSGSEEALEGSVDFPVLRDNLKAEFRDRLAGELGGDGGGNLGDLGTSIGMAMIDPIVDGLVTPEAIATVVRQGNVLPQGRGDATSQPSGEAEWTVERGLSRFTARQAEGETALVFERRGLGWKLVGIDLPKD